MTNDDYQATGIKDFDKLADLLETRRHTIQTLINIVDGSQHKVTAYNALKAARLHFDKAILDELQKNLESHKAVGLLEKSTTEPAKPQMTEEQKNLTTCFHNALVNLKKYVVPYMERSGIERYNGIYNGMVNEVHLYGKKLLAEWKNQFEE